MYPFDSAGKGCNRLVLYRLRKNSSIRLSCIGENNPWKRPSAFGYCSDKRVMQSGYKGIQEIYKVQENIYCGSIWRGFYKSADRSFETCRCGSRDSGQDIR